MLINSFLAYNKEDNIRLKSSSGGIFYSLAKHTLDNGGVVFGAAWTENWFVDIKHISDLNSLSQLMGSKYIQADVKNTYKECEQFLKEGKLVLYSGLPCQLHGLKNFLKKEYNNLILVDIACHGLPLPKLWKDYLETLKRPDAEIVSINFRLKEPDWNNYAFEVKYSDDKVFTEHHNKNKYMKAFLNDKYLKSSCYNCKFKNEFSVADITIGDAWGQEKIKDTKKGISFIITRTQKGDELINKLNLYKEKVLYTDKSKNGCLNNNILINPEKYTTNIFKKKVGIITLHVFDNIGGILQAFALNKVINNLGYDAETITFKDNRLLPFAKNNIKLRIFDSAKDIKNIKETDYDIFVVGSDQIWRKKYTWGEFNKDYLNIPFLQFTNNWIKTRFSYAASFGVGGDSWEYNKTEDNLIADLLNQFNAVSVREVQSVEDCAKHLGIHTIQFLDPTFLLSKEEYESLCSPIEIDKDYIFTYFLDSNNTKINDVNTIANNFNLDIKNNSGKDVGTWLSYIKNCKLVVTDSFHGVVFSIIFNKPFLYYSNISRGADRFASLEKIFNINTKQITDKLVIKKDLFTPLNIKIDSTTAIKYLINSLADSPKRLNSTAKIINNESNVKPKKTNSINEDDALPNLNDWFN